VQREDTGGDDVGPSEKIGKVTEEQRRRETERSLPSLGRASACSLRRTPGTVFPARTQVREPV